MPLGPIDGPGGRGFVQSSDNAPFFRALQAKYGACSGSFLSVKVPNRQNSGRGVKQGHAVGHWQCVEHVRNRVVAQGCQLRWD